MAKRKRALQNEESEKCLTRCKVCKTQRKVRARQLTALCSLCGCYRSFGFSRHRITLLITLKSNGRSGSCFICDSSKSLEPYGRSLSGPICVTSSSQLTSKRPHDQYSEVLYTLEDQEPQWQGHCCCAPSPSHPNTGRPSER